MKCFWESFPAYGDCILQQARAVPSASGKWASPPCGLTVVCFPCDIIFEQQAGALCFLFCLVNPITKPGPFLGGPCKISKKKTHQKQKTNAMWYNNHKKYRDCFDRYLKISFSRNGMFQPTCPFYLWVFVPFIPFTYSVPLFFIPVSQNYQPGKWRSLVHDAWLSLGLEDVTLHKLPSRLKNSDLNC